MIRGLPKAGMNRAIGASQTGPDGDEDETGHGAECCGGSRDGSTSGQSSVRPARITIAVGLTCALVTGLPTPAWAFNDEIVDKLHLGVSERVSVSSSGQEGNANSGRPCQRHPDQYSASDSGRFVAFTSEASNLHPSDVNGPIPDVFVYDRKKKELDLVSMLPTGLSPTVPVPPDADAPCLDLAFNLIGSYSPQISGNGRYVAFTSTFPLTEDSELETATPLLKVFVRDLHSGRTEFISRTWDGGPPDGHSGDDDWFGPGVSISDDGRWVAFRSAATNIVREACPSSAVPGTPAPVLPGRCSHVYARDRVTRETVLVSARSPEMPVEYESRQPFLSGNGRYVLFDTIATAAGIPIPCTPQRPGCSDVFVADLRTGTTELISVSRDGEVPANGPSIVFGGGASAISDNGRYVNFSSAATDLVPASGCGSQYVRDRKTGRTEHISVTSTGAVVPAHPLSQLSDDGRYSIIRTFGGSCSGSVDDPPEFSGDLLYDRETGQLDLLSCWGNDSHGGDESTQPCPRIASEFHPPHLGSNARFLIGTHYDEEVVANDTNEAYDVFFRDIGRYSLGAGPLGDPPPQQQSEPPNDRICIEDVCIPPSGKVSRRANSSMGTGVQEAPASTKLYGASLAYRPEPSDLYAAIELEHMGPIPTIGPAGILTAGNPSVLYGLRFKIGVRIYDVRATSLLGGTFGLFDCTDPAPLCTQLATLKGGYGTTGERVVFSLPLEEIGLKDGGKLRDVKAFSALGSYLTGATEILDSVKLK